MQTWIKHKFRCALNVLFIIIADYLLCLLYEAYEALETVWRNTVSQVSQVSCMILHFCVTHYIQWIRLFANIAEESMPLMLLMLARNVDHLQMFLTVSVVSVKIIYTYRAYKSYTHWNVIKFGFTNNPKCTKTINLLFLIFDTFVSLIQIINWRKVRMSAHLNIHNLKVDSLYI